MANILSSQIVFKIKMKIDGSLKLKGRIVVRGYRDAEIDIFRRDSSVADINQYGFP